MTKLTAPNLFYFRGKVYPAEENDVLEIKSLFDKAVLRINSSNTEISDTILVQLRSLYNQATKGDIDIQSLGKPSDTNAKAEFDAWTFLKGKSIKDAQSEYVVLVNKLKF